jgi:NhaA family Na+:H+ antiporter
MPAPRIAPREVVGARALPQAVREFLRTETSGGVLLVLAAVTALVWANSPWHAGYEELWRTRVTLQVGSVGIDDDLRHLVNNGLMALFFLVVGLEIKRELVVGELRSWRAAALPTLAAAGGMVVPALLYTALNVGGPGSAGWGIPMATDIAFAVGVLALLGPRVPGGLKLFLLTLAVVDDIGSIVVIAVAYSDAPDAAALGIAGASVAVALVCLRLRIWSPLVYVPLGVACWLALYESGVHATLAGVIFGLLTPAEPLAPAEVARDWARDLSDEPTAEEMRSLTTVAQETVSVAERVQHQLHPLTSFAVVPVFALANAGVRITGDALAADGASRVVAGVVVGLVAGKLVGITGATALAVRLGLARLPEGVSRGQIAGVGALAGVGFTVSLFIADVAFDTPALDDAAKLAVLVASVVASLVGASVLAAAGRRAAGSPRPADAPGPGSGTAR